MELRHMRYFVAIAEERSFTRAAERLWVAQPGLSTQIRRLEAELGVRLFVRHTRGVDLTEAGELFLERVRATLAAAELAAVTGSDLAAGLVGTLRIGLSTPARWGSASSLLDTFARTHPSIEVTIVEAYGGSLARDLRDGRLDAVLGLEADGAADLRGVRLGSEPWVVIAARGHELGGDGPLNAADLEGEEIVVTSHRDGAGYDRAVAATLAELGVTVALRRGGPGPALFESVASGEALALTTASAVPGTALSVRPLMPTHRLGYVLHWQAEQPGPALTELIRLASPSVRRDDDRRPVLRAAA